MPHHTTPLGSYYVHYEYVVDKACLRRRMGRTARRERGAGHNVVMMRPYDYNHLCLGVRRTGYPSSIITTLCTRLVATVEIPIYPGRSDMVYVMDCPLPSRPRLYCSYSVRRK